jgi:hypothetical protein
MLGVTAIFRHSRQDSSQVGQTSGVGIYREPGIQNQEAITSCARQAALRTYFFTCGVPAAGAFAHLGVREMIISRKLR